MKNYVMKRITSKAFWISLFALIPLALQTFGDTSILPGNYEEIVNGFLTLLVAAGLVNNPTTSKGWYTDDVNEQIEE